MMFGEFQINLSLSLSLSNGGGGGERGEGGAECYANSETFFLLINKNNGPNEGSLMANYLEHCQNKFYPFKRN